MTGKHPGVGRTVLTRRFEFRMGVPVEYPGRDVAGAEAAFEQHYADALDVCDSFIESYVRAANRKLKRAV